MLISRALTLFLGLGLLGLGACQNSPSQEEADEAPIQLDEATIAGDWAVLTAFRNDKETATLNGASFRFAEGQMQSDVPSFPEQSSYRLEDKAIVVDGPPAMRYAVEHCTPDTLVFSVRVGEKFDFRLVLGRPDPNAAPSGESAVGDSIVQ